MLFLQMCFAKGQADLLWTCGQLNIAESYVHGRRNFKRGKEVYLASEEPMKKRFISYGLNQVLRSCMHGYSNL